MKHLAISFIALLTCLHINAQLPKYEVRAVWLTTLSGLDWPKSHKARQQKEELRKTLDLLKAGGINTVLYQARIRGTVAFPSAMEPWDACMTGQAGVAPDYDPLQLVIDECHSRGMEVHAWVVTIPIGKYNAYGCKQLKQHNPSLIKKIGDDAFLNPEKAETADYLAAICSDIVKRYDVDGIHLDYIRYPERWPLAKSAQERADRRRNITHIVEAINWVVKSQKPWVKMSCSPIGKHDDLLRYRSGGWNARTAMGQDAQAWLQRGLMDMLFPMMYFRDNQFFPFAIDWKEQDAGRIVVPGLGVYFLDPKEGRNWQLDDVTRQMNVSRQLGMGHCYFRSKFFTDNIKGLYDFGKHFDATPALIPPMTWENKTAPGAPEQLRHRGKLLTWKEAENRNDSPYLLYNIYASKNYPVDVNDPQNLVAWRITNSFLNVPSDKDTYYAVTATDRYGQESEACQLPDIREYRFWQTDDIQKTNGNWVRLPEKPATLDANVLLIETLQGQQVGAVEYKGKYADISYLPDGIYILRSLGKKNRNHRMVYFSIKR